MNDQSFHAKLWELYNAAGKTYTENGRGAYDAGRIDGIKQALELLAEMESASEASHE